MLVAMELIRSKVETAQKLLEEVAEALNTYDSRSVVMININGKEVDFVEWVNESVNGKNQGEQK